MIKILHTADWHLGKKLFHHDRLDEMRSFLKWLSHTIKDNSIDLLFISGDIFDVPTPPHEAQKLYFEFLYDVTTNTKCEIFIIAGNHDSGNFLEAPKYFLKENRIHICGRLEDNFDSQRIQLEIDNKKLLITLLPFFRNYELLKNVEDEPQKVKDFFIESLSTKNYDYDYSFLLAHHLFGDFSEGGSEQVVTLSGIDSITAEMVKGQYDYLALGHIHKTQKIFSDPLAIYPGSPIAMRFSEKNQKYVSLIELEDKLTQTYLPIPLELPLIRIECQFKDLYQKLNEVKKENKKALLELVVNLSKPVSGLADQIKKYLADSDIELISFQFLTNEDRKANKLKPIEQLNTDELFELFYQSKYNQSPPENIIKDFNELLAEVRDYEN